MDINDAVEMMERAISVEAAKTDALTAALAGVLEAGKDNPRIVESVVDSLERELSVQQKKPNSEHYMNTFEVMREYLRKKVE